MEQVEAHNVKEGMHIMMDGLPCRVRIITNTGTGKHGHAKSHIVGVCVLTGKKREMIQPGDKPVQVATLQMDKMSVTHADRDNNVIELLDADANCVSLDIVPRFRVLGMALPHSTTKPALDLVAFLDSKEKENDESEDIEAIVLTAPVLEAGGDVQHRQVLVEWHPLKPAESSSSSQSKKRHY
jgi:translation elongation factor P/translation initiation factor 5A